LKTVFREGSNMAASAVRRPKIRLLLSDVDGTLVTHDKKLTERTIAAVARVHAAGITFAVTSGRPARGMSMLVEPLTITEPLAGFNGGQLMSPSGKLLEEHTLPDEIVAALMSTISSHQLDVWVFRGNDWFVRDAHGPHVEREERAVQFSATVVPNFDSFRQQIVKVVGVSDDPAAVEAAESACRSQFGDHVSATRSQTYYLDVTHPLANKGTVVRRLAERLKISRDEIATIGDMANDVLMFAHSGTSIAMGNATREVQRAARYVTTSNEEEGFANAVERYVLGDG